MLFHSCTIFVTLSLFGINMVMYNAGAVPVEYSGFGNMERRAINYQGSRQKGHLFSGILGEGPFILRNMERRVIYFQGYGEKGHLFSEI